MVVANCLGHEAQLDRALNLQVTRSIVAAVDVPVMADGEDGYGGPDEIGETIEAFIDTGVAGINLEDQVIGAAAGVTVVEQTVMVEKLQAASEAAHSAGDPGLVINGRTDALLAAGDLTRPSGVATRTCRQETTWYSSRTLLLWTKSEKLLEALPAQ